MMLPQRTSFVQVGVNSQSERSSDSRSLSKVDLARMVDALSSAEVPKQCLQFLGTKSLHLFEWIAQCGLSSALSVIGVDEAMRFVSRKHE